MGMVAILVMSPRHYEQTFVSPPHGGSTCNLVLIGPALTKEMFENVDANVDANANQGPLSIL